MYFFGLLGVYLILFCCAGFPVAARVKTANPLIEAVIALGDPIADRLMLDLHLDGNQAAGILAHLMAESNFDPKAIGPHSRHGKGAIGIAQWIGPRRHAFELYVGATNLSIDSMEVNILFLELELETNMNEYLLAVKKTHDPAAATRAFIGFEDAALSFRKEHLGKRLQYARLIAEHLDYRMLP